MSWPDPEIRFAPGTRTPPLGWPQRSPVGLPGGGRVHAGLSHRPRPHVVAFAAGPGARLPGARRGRQRRCCDAARRGRQRGCWDAGCRWDCSPGGRRRDPRWPWRRRARSRRHRRRSARFRRHRRRRSWCWSPWGRASRQLRGQGGRSAPRAVPCRSLRPHHARIREAGRLARVARADPAGHGRWRHGRCGADARAGATGVAPSGEGGRGLRVRLLGGAR